MRAFAVSGLVFFHSTERDCLRNDLFCVEWDVKPQRNQSAACPAAAFPLPVRFRCVALRHALI